MANTAPTFHVLLLTADPRLVTQFADASKGLGVEAQCSNSSQEASHQLSRTKYEGVLVDFDTVPNARPTIASVRESRSNKNAVVFAVATEVIHAEQALEDRAHFVLRRPIQISTIRQTLDAAYDLMVGERRRHFRYAVSLPLRLALIRSGTTFQCSTLNISSNGMAVRSPVPFKLAEPLDIALSLPDGSTVCATGTVIWDDKHGKSGLHFDCRIPEMRQKLDSWLDAQFKSNKAGE
jgi:PilZ domain